MQFMKFHNNHQPEFRHTSSIVRIYKICSKLTWVHTQILNSSSNLGLQFLLQAVLGMLPSKPSYDKHLLKLLLHLNPCNLIPKANSDLDPGQMLLDK